MTEEEQEVGERKSLQKDKETTFAAGSLSRKHYPTKATCNNLVALLSYSPSSSKIRMVYISNRSETGGELFLVT